MTHKCCPLSYVCWTIYSPNQPVRKRNHDFQNMYRSSLYRTQSAQEILHGSGIFANITGPCLLNVDKQFQHHGAADGHELIATIVCFTFLIVLNFCQIKFCKNILFWAVRNDDCTGTFWMLRIEPFKFCA